MMQLRPNAAKYIFFKKRERLKKKKKSQGKSSREEETEKAKGEEVDYGQKTGPQASSGTPESSTVHHWSTPRALSPHSFLHSWPFWKVQHFQSKYCSSLVVDFSFRRRLVTTGETNGNLQTPKAPALVPRFWPAFTLCAAEEPGKMPSIPSSQDPIFLNLVRPDSQGTSAKSGPPNC